MLVGKSIGVLHATQELPNALSVTDRAVFVTHGKRAQVTDLFVELGNLGAEAVILGRVHFDLGLKISQPLFLALATFQGGNPDRG